MGALIFHHPLPKLCAGRNVPEKMESKKGPSRTVHRGPVRTAGVARSPAPPPPAPVSRIPKADPRRPKSLQSPHGLLNKLVCTVRIYPSHSLLPPTRTLGGLCADANGDFYELPEAVCPELHWIPEGGAVTSIFQMVKWRHGS